MLRGEEGLAISQPFFIFKKRWCFECNNSNPVLGTVYIKHRRGCGILPNR